ncbi:MAG: hypothetical protein KC766_03775 [Myxococcales bacterium]|nr:hypothetical protein [Myxococcales bacterium]
MRATWACIPARDVFAFCNCESQEGVAALRGIGAQPWPGGDRLLTKQLSRRTDGPWQPFDPKLRSRAGPVALRGEWGAPLGGAGQRSMLMAGRSLGTIKPRKSRRSWSAWSLSPSWRTDM